MKSKKKIYIHIGPHKTGTTTIQVNLRKNQKRLSEKSILVPKTGRQLIGSKFAPFMGRIVNRSAGHHNLGWELMGSKRFTPKYGTWNDLVDEINKFNGSTVILTAESFSKFDEEMISKVKKNLEPYDIQVIMYLRRQDKMVQSLWTQRIKNPYLNLPAPFPIFIKGDKKFKEIIDYKNFIDIWGHVFGERKLIIRILEREQLNGHLFHDFLTVCGVKDADSYPIIEDANVSPGIRSLEYIYFLKSNLRKQIAKEDFRIIVRAVDNYQKGKSQKEVKVNFFDDDLYKNFMSKYSAMNKEIAKRFFDREELFLEPFEEKEITPFRFDSFSFSELHPIISSLPHRLEKKVMEANLLFSDQEI